MTEFDFSNGMLYINNIAINKDTSSLDVKKTEARFFYQYQDWSTYTIREKLWSYKFSISIQLQKDMVYEINLKSENMYSKDDDWFPTEKELLKEKKFLSEIIQSETDIKPSNGNLSTDIYEFNWGYIGIHADLKSSMTSISVMYK